MDKVLLSVIIPCHNYAHFLSRTMKSVFKQTYKNWECIIINDGSMDDTKSIADQLMHNDSRIKVIHQENKGLSNSRNIGIKEAKGEFIQFLDADDILVNTKFEKQLLYFKNNPSMDIVYSNFEFFREDPSFTIIPKNKGIRLALKDDPVEDFLFNWGIDGLIIPIHCPLFKRETLINNTIFFDEALRAREDWLFWIQLAMAGCKMEFVDEVLAYYRKHQKSMVHDPVFMFHNKLKSIFRVYEIIAEDYKEPFKNVYINYLLKQYDYEVTRFNNLKNSHTYRLGNNLLYPYRILKKIFLLLQN